MSEISYRSNVPGQLAYTPANVRNTGPRKHLYTWMMSLRPLVKTLDGNDGGTEFRCLDIPDDFYAVRVGFMNRTTSTYAVTLIKAAGSAPTESYITPVDEDGVALTAADWSTLTTLGAGANGTELVTVSGAPTALTVLANATDANTGKTDNPAYSMTDWVACESRGADPVTGMRRLMIRALVPSSQNVTYNGESPTTGWDDNPAVNKGYFSWVGGKDNNADYVTDPTTANALPNTGNTQISGNGPIMAFVQVMTRRPCVQGINGGDSTMAGALTNGGIYNMSLISATTLGQEFVGHVPISNVNAATGGAPNSVFFPCLQDILPIVQPTYCILPGWSSNDLNVDNLTPDEMVAQFSARLSLAADAARAVGAVPIYCTPWGDDSMTEDERVAWRELRARVLSLAVTGNIVVDQFALCGDVTTGVYASGMAYDGLHPTDEANVRATQLLIPAIKRVAGL